MSVCLKSFTIELHTELHWNFAAGVRPEEAQGVRRLLQRYPLDILTLYPLLCSWPLKVYDAFFRDEGDYLSH